MIDKDEVETVLRSVVATARNGMELELLSEEYRDLVGHQIPFREFGFSSLKEYLQSIPHVVRVKMSRDGQATAYSVSNSSTAHITKMVSKQRRKKRGRTLDYAPEEDENITTRHSKWSHPNRHYSGGQRVDRTASCDEGLQVWRNFLREAGLMPSYIQKYSSLFHMVKLAPEDLKVCTALDLEKLGVSEYLNVDLILAHAFPAPRHVRCASGNFKVSGAPWRVAQKKVCWNVGKLQVTITNDRCNI